MRIARPAALAVIASGCLSKPGLDCELAAVGAGQIDAQIGTAGGVPSGATDCGPRAVVGVGFWLTRDPNMMFGEKTAVRAALRCATLENHDGGYATGATEDLAAIGGSEAKLDGPFFAECPGGRVVIGLAAQLLGATGLFNSIAIDCAALDPGGAPAGDAVRVPVVGTGTGPTEVEAACREGRVLHGLESVSGRELDQVKLRCAQATCGPPP